MPYPNALIQATPRNAMLGRLSDALAGTYSPERTQQAQQLAQFLSIPAISRTLDKLSYGEPLTTGAGGLGGTTRFNNDALEAAFAVAPMVGPAAKLAGKGAMATGRFVAPKAGQLAEQYMVKTGGILPLDVYHGTPHTLPPTARNPLGEFDASKIGTGEGAQAYGYGIYTAENPSVAKSYKDQLSPRDITKKNESQVEDWSSWAASNSDSSDDALKKIETLVIQSKNNSPVPKGFSDWDEFEKFVKQETSKRFGGNLYKIDLPDEKIAKMLDWDAPLKDQTPEIQALAKQYGLTDADHLGGDLLVAMNAKRAAGANAMREAGIPGVKYLDEQSRNAGGTRNFVVFPGEEKSMTILERNGQKFDNSALTGAKSVAPQEKTLSNLSYRGSHTAPGPDFGAPLHDLTGGGQMYPADVYSAKAAQYYGTGYPKADKEAFALAQRVRGNPNAEVTMYRAVPKDESITSINPGDWVTLSKDYAKTHGESVLENNYNILSQKVKAKDLWTNADSIHEFGYQPQNTTSTSVQFDNSALMK
jgi:hypothetical protein